MRQHNSRSICKQTGGHQVHTPLLQDMVSNVNGYSEQSDIQSSSHSGEIKRSCRSSVSKQNTTHRVDTEQSDSSISVCNVGRTNNRFVCLGTQSQETSVLCLDTSSQCSSSRRSVDIMGKNVGICISTNMSNSKSTKTHESIQLSTNSDSSNVAKKTLVHRASSKISSKSNKTTNKAKSTVSTKNKHLPSKSRSVHANSLAALHKNFRNKGFSRETRKLLRASWRSGTQQDYACKFKRFHSWCSEREKDPYAATLAECADFLSHLYTSGLQYRTIAGYRSMLSSLLSPIDNVPIGQHPYIIRLLRGVFNSRPPKVNLVPEWDLQNVLDMLQKSPFETLLKADIKCLTYKVVFLTAITTYRRCSDLQALRIGEGFVNVQKKGLVFLRPGLSKQDRPNHYGTKIFVPYFEHNKKLDPKRAIAIYLKRTEETRKDEGKLFLSTVKPFKPVTSQTISRWLVNTIKMAYENTDFKVKAHSTRAIGPSWALFNGASMKSILESADWSTDTTFIKFYLRNVDVKVLS